MENESDSVICFLLLYAGDKAGSGICNSAMLFDISVPQLEFNAVLTPR